MSVLDSILQCIAPHQCVGCGKDGSALCKACTIHLPDSPLCCYRCGAPTVMGRTCAACRRHSPVIQLWAATPYEGHAKEIVHRLKYERAQAAAACLAEAMVSRLPLPSSSWILVHAPTAPARVRARGYDQAQLIARALGRRLHLPVAAALARQTTAHQVGQSGRTRRKQMSGAFTVVKASVVQNTNVLLIDDVVTTGATLEAAAAALHEAGAKHIAAAVFARA